MLCARPDVLDFRLELHSFKSLYLTLTNSPEYETPPILVDESVKEIRITKDGKVTLIR